MSTVFNPVYREPRIRDKSDSPAKRSYYRLRALPTGENNIKAVPLREIFSVNGTATHDRIGEQLSELKAEGLVTYMRLEFGVRVSYRISLERLPEELPENALLVPKSIKEDLTDAQIISHLWMRLEDDKLGTRTSFTIKDWQNCRRLLKDNSLEVVKKAVKRFWSVKAENRKNPNFTEFYFNFPRLANDARDELEIESAIKVEKIKAERPPETEREYLKREIKYQSTRDPEWAARLQKELDELDDEEDERD